MRKRSRRTRNFRGFLLFGIVLTLILILIVSTVGRRTFNSPHKLVLELLGTVQYAITSVVGSVKNVWHDYIALLDVRDENKELRLELAHYRSTNIQYLEAAATNIRLQKLLELKESYPLPTLTARIIGKDPSPWFRTIIIDQGSSDGVQKGMPLISVEGVVGQVVNTGPHYAKVLLANDPNSAIDVLVQRTRAQGLIKGNGRNGYIMHYVLKNADVQKGDQVVTSGLGDIFPKGLPTGTVTKVVKSRRGMFQQIEVEPTVNFALLEHLHIILKEKSITE